MSVNGITSTTGAYSTYATTNKKTGTTTAETAANTETAASTKEASGVIYEPSAEATTTTATQKYTPDKNLIAQLKADADARTAQLRSLVEQMMSKQTNTYGKATDIWKFLASGEYTVDPATKAQAQADIAEDGYWGVEATSDRILDFAKALTGGDPDKIEEMRDAFEKGFKQATKTWGGELPEISQKTYDATMAKFDAWANEANGTTNVEAADMNGEV